MIDGDGNLDLATPANPNRRYVSFLLGNGDGTFRPPVTTYLPLEGIPALIAPGVGGFQRRRQDGSGVRPDRRRLLV